MTLLPVMIICLAIAMVIGPIMLMQPTARQRQLGKLRQHAAKQGLRVNLSEQTDLNGRKASSYTLPQAKKKGVLPLSWCLCHQTFSHDVHFHDIWDWRSDNESLSSNTDVLHTLLDEAPKGVCAIGRNTIGVFVDWVEICDEGAEEQVIDHLAHFLTRLASEQI